MMPLLTFVFAISYGFVLWQFSSVRMRRMLDTQSTPLDHPGLAPILDEFARVLELRRIPVRVYEIPTLNGLADSDGRVFITRGFIERFEAGEISAEEIASVIAHEMGHVALGHTRRRLIDFTGQNALKLALTGILRRFVPFADAMISNTVAALLAARLSRQDEYNADAWASALMIRSGIGTGPQKQLFRRLEQMAGSSGHVPAWLMTHPRPSARIAAIAENEERWGISA